MKQKWFFPTLLLVLHVFLLLSFAANNFFTVDEPIGIAGGISILRNNNYSVNPENGILCQVLSALPLKGIVHQVRIDYKGPNRFLSGQQLLFQDSISPEKLLFFSRSCMCLLSLLCGWLVYLLAKSCCGYRAGIFALSIYVFFPIVLANGCLATSDMALSCTLFLFLCLFMRLLRHIHNRAFPRSLCRFDPCGPFQNVRPDHHRLHAGSDPADSLAAPRFENTTWKI